MPDARAAGKALAAAGVALLGEARELRTGWLVEVADPWGNVIGLTDYLLAPSGPGSARTATPPVTRTLLTGGRVFDGTGAPPREADVLVEGDRSWRSGPGWTATRRSTSAAATCCRGCSTATPTSP